MTFTSRLPVAITIALCLILKTLAQNHQITEATKQNLLELLQRVQKQNDYQTIALCGMPRETPQRCLFYEMIDSLQAPVLLITVPQNYSYHSYFSKRLLLLHCLQHADNVAETLRGYQIVHRLAGAHIFAFAPHAHNASLLEAYCKSFLAQELYNVLLVLADLDHTNLYYTCQRQQSFVARNISTTRLIYAPPFRDMHGDIIRTYPDQSLPYTLVYNDTTSGRLRASGIVIKLLEAYATQHNATLVYHKPLELNKVVFYGRLMAEASRGELDIAAAFTSTLSENSLEKMSYPYTITRYCFIIPMPLQIHLSVIFFVIVRKYIYIALLCLVIVFAVLLTHLERKPHRRLGFVNIFLNDKSIRGILGQSFTMKGLLSNKMRYVCLLLCYFSLITNTTYQAYLQSYLIKPPTEPWVRNYADIERYGLKILFARQELEVLTGHEMLERYKHITKVVGFDEFQSIRDTMDTRYVYAMTNTKWQVTNFIQQIMKKEIFYYGDEAVINGLVELCVPLRPDLPYREHFELFIMYVQAAGLMEHWMFTTMQEILHFRRRIFAFGKINWKEQNEPGEHLAMYDLVWIWLAYVNCMAVCVLSFLLEKLHWFVRQKTKKRKHGHFRNPK